MLPARGSVLGVDVGCSPTRRSSAICRLDWTEDAVSWSIQRFRATEDERYQTIVGSIGESRLVAAAFDGPLRGDLEVIGVYRVAESMLTRRLARVIGKPGQSSAPVGKALNHHANLCARVVLSSDALGDANHAVRIHRSAIVEAFPSSFLGVMIDSPEGVEARRKDRSDRYFAFLEEAGLLVRLVLELLPGRLINSDPGNITNHDDRAAFVCALTALCVSTGRYAAVGDDNGWIILPPSSFIAPWAMDLLRLNDAELGGGRLMVA